MKKSDLKLDSAKRLRILVWNCHMALSKKRTILYALKPDIAIIPECSRDAAQLCEEDGYSSCWWGNQKSKGLAVLAAKPWKLQKEGSANQRWIAPVTVIGCVTFQLIAVWACRIGNIREMNYIGQVFEAFAKHGDWFDGKLPTVVGGDFNSNASFRPRKIRNHQAVLRILEKHDLVSAYHHFFSEEQGEETRHTHYFRYQKASPWHIDYVFLPRSWLRSVSKVSVGSYSKWKSHSDHVPLVIDLSLPALVQSYKRPTRNGEWTNSH